MRPSSFLIFHLHNIMEMTVKRSTRKRRILAQTRPLVSTATGDKPWVNV